MIKIQWKSFTDYDLVLEIDDGSETVTNLTPSAQPFITQGDDSNDMFQPIRAQSGNIGIVATLQEFEQLVGNYPLQRPVTLKSSKNGSQPVVQWKGYIQSAAYSQDWIGGNMEISVPVVSRIGVWEHIRSGAVDVFWSFADIIKHAGNAVGGFDGYIFPTFINPETTLGYKILMRNFATRDASVTDYNVYETATYEELIEAFCKLFGLVCIEWKKNLCFIAPDYSGNYIQYSEANLDQIDNGESATSPQTLTGTVVNSTVNRADNSISYLPGKRRVKVTGKVNPFDLTLCSINGDEINVDPSDDPTSQNYYAKTYVRVHENGYDCYYTIKYRTDQYQFLKTYDGVGDNIANEITNRNIRFENFAGMNTNQHGCCFTKERQFYDLFRDHPGAIYKDSGWNHKILFRLTQSQIENASTSTPLVMIKSREKLNRSNMLANKYMTITGQVRVCDGSTNEYNWNAFTGYLWVLVQYGTDTIYNGWMTVDDGQILGGYLRTQDGEVMGMDQGGFVIPFPSDMTEHNDFLVFGISATNTPGHYYNNGKVQADKFYSIEGFKVTLENKWDELTPPLNEDEENTATADTGNGWVEDIDVEIPMTIAVDRSSLKMSDQFGKGIILANDVDDENPHVLYNNKTPEEALKDRFVDHYSNSKKMLKASVQIPATYGPLQPWQTHSPDSQGSWALLAQTIDWRDDVITGKFFER